MITTSILGLELIVDPSLRWTLDLLGYLSDVSTVTTEEGPLHGSLVIEAGNAHNDLPGGDELEKGLLATDGVLLDTEYRVRVDFPSRDRIVLRTFHSCPEWFSWALQLLALRSRATFVHAAGVERNGAALLLGARNGFGKTALVADFVRRRGFRFLSDDLTLLSADGTCHAYPRALVVHPEHRTFLPEVFARGDGPSASAPLSAFIERASHAVKPVLRRVPGLLERARHRHPHTARVTPSSIFGSANIAPRARLQNIVWLERRAGLTEPILRKAGDTMPARAFGGTLNEFDARCVRTTNHAMTLGMLPLDDSYGAWADVLRSGLTNTRAYTLAVPATVPFEQMPGTVYDVLSAEGIAGPPAEGLCI